MEVTPIERNVRGLLKMPFLLIIANRWVGGWVGEGVCVYCLLPRLYL